jgi:hypothetical protein
VAHVANLAFSARYSAITSVDNTSKTPPGKPGKRPVINRCSLGSPVRCVFLKPSAFADRVRRPAIAHPNLHGCNRPLYLIQVPRLFREIGAEWFHWARRGCRSWGTWVEALAKLFALWAWPFAYQLLRRFDSQDCRGHTDPADLHLRHESYAQALRRAVRQST